ncbi:MAG TPA: bacillithiol biosynthesis cysteine-adding enzyme BshC [Puia sp.]|nr:bacillithiol biosynthesis cysteine-adding enzyme BshC [Puia sp.]
MDWIPTRLSYRQTGYFSKIITDYLDQADALTSFYAHPVSLKGICASLEDRQRSPVNRQVLVTALKKQYEGVAVAPLVQQNIDRLADGNTFTVCTAHQPAIFTGSLYFIYKILHTIKLAAHLSTELPQYRFVPVFYMGSEDADLEELGKIWLDQEKLVWDTKQTGAVGRMKPAGLEKIMHRIEGEFSVQPFGGELGSMLREAYLESPDIQTGTFRLIHRLFAEYGLVVLIPDEAGLKRLMISVFEDDLFRQTPSRLVDDTIQRLSRHYKVQANPRAINLFYLKDDLRGRIEKSGDKFVVHDSRLVFGEEEMRKELQQYPERFSPNVILRGLFQEMILPNLAFIGGGGETAYWLEFKDLFAHYNVSFPVLILRNSFLLLEEQWNEKLENAGVTVTKIFTPEEELINELVRRQSQQRLNLEQEITEATLFYEKLKKLSGSVDPTLSQHVEALQAKALAPLKDLEKKLLKAEKRKFNDQRRQIHTIQSALFPLNGLQERIDNFLPWYAKRGRKFIGDLYAQSLSLEQEFVILAETKHGDEQPRSGAGVAAINTQPL